MWNKINRYWSNNGENTNITAYKQYGIAADNIMGRTWKTYLEIRCFHRFIVCAFSFIFRNIVRKRHIDWWLRIRDIRDTLIVHVYDVTISMAALQPEMCQECHCWEFRCWLIVLRVLVKLITRNLWKRRLIYIFTWQCSYFTYVLLQNSNQ